MSLTIPLHDDDGEYDEAGREFVVGCTVEWAYNSSCWPWAVKGTRGTVLEIFPHPNGMSRAVIQYEGRPAPTDEDEPTPLFALCRVD